MSFLRIREELARLDAEVHRLTDERNELAFKLGQETARANDIEQTMIRNVVDVVLAHVGGGFYESLPDVHAALSMLRYNLRALREWTPEQFRDAVK